MQHFRIHCFATAEVAAETEADARAILADLAEKQTGSICLTASRMHTTGAYVFVFIAVDKDGQLEYLGSGK